MEEPGAVGTFEYADERFSSPPKALAYWRDSLEAAEKAERDWHEDAERATRIYSQSSSEGDEYTTTGGGRSFNILHSNAQVIVSASYNSTPLPDVRTRDLDKDPVTDAMAELGERGIAHQLDIGDFDGTMLDVITQAYVAGRGVPRIRYESYEHTDKTEGTKVAFEEIHTELVDWRDFRRGPGKQWRDVPWIGFRQFLSREDIKTLLTPDDGSEMDPDRIEHILEQIPFNEQDRDTPRLGEMDKRAEAGVTGRAECWEIWDKEARLVWWVCLGYPDGPLATLEDPFGMVEFFPVPQPLVHTPGMGSLVPLCPYEFYRAQAEELERTSQRIQKLTDCLKWRGIRASEISELEEVVDKADGEFVPSQGALSVLAQGKGLDDAIWTMPIDILINVVRELVQIREQQKVAIYEMTGISDIMRGSTDPNETLGAQDRKIQFGSLRIKRFQRNVQRVCRDLFRIMSHIIANVFSDQTLQVINGKPIDPMVMQAVRNDFVQRMRVDVETDSTVRGDLDRIQGEQANFLEATGNFVSAVGPVVASPANPAGFIPPQVAVEVFTAFARSFRLGRQVEDVLATLSKQVADAAANPQPQGPSPEEQQAQAQMQAEQQRMQAEMAMKQQEVQLRKEEKQIDLQVKMQERQQDLEFKQAEAAQKQRLEAAKMAMEAEKFEREMVMEERRMALQAQADERKAMMDGQKMQFEQDRAAKVSDDEMRRQYLKSGLPPGFDHNTFRGEVEAELEEEMEKALTEFGRMMAEALQKMSEGQAQQTEALMQAITAPKEVVRDGSGRAVGVKTVGAERMN